LRAAAAASSESASAATSVARDDDAADLGRAERARAAAVTAAPLEGLSLAGLHAFIDAHGGRAAFVGKTTSDVKREVVLPRMAAWEGAYTAELRRGGGGAMVARANAFASHVYSGRFLDAVEALEAWEARTVAHGGAAGARFFYYFDLLVVDQRKDGVIAFEALRDTFGPGVRSAGRVLLVLDEAAVAMTRLWCVFELVTACELSLPLEVVMPPRDEAAFLRALESDFDSLCRRTMTVDVQRAVAYMPEDERNIRAVIEGGVGYLRANQLVIGGMQSWMVARARAALAAAPPAKRDLLTDRLASLLQSQGVLEEAGQLFGQVLNARRAALGSDHADTLSSINNMAKWINHP
jgi:hypothetical protein